MAFNVSIHTVIVIFNIPKFTLRAWFQILDTR